MELDKKQIRAIFITGVLILFILLVFLIGSVIAITKNNQTNKNIDVNDGYSTIEELVEHYGCKYNNDTYREKREFPVEVNLVFKKKLYENDESQEKYFDEIIKALAKFVRYKSFQMIDTENDITIKVICQDGRITQTIINDIEDYFIYKESEMELTRYKEIDTTSLHTDIEALNFLIDNDWSSDVNFGIRESIFKNYNIHFDEGVKYRKIGSSIYNVIFTDTYPNPVVNNISVGTSLSSIEELLGTATFKDDDLGVIGYKGKDIYVFFTKNEISIYKNKSYDYEDFWNLVDDFLENDEMQFRDFINELTYIWKDYSEYDYAEDYMFMAFPNRGVEIKLNYDDVSGIILYNNVSEELDITKKYLQNTEFISRLQLDSVFEAEKRRLQADKAFEEECINLEKEAESKSMLFYSNLEKDDNDLTTKVYFLSKNGEFPNRELIKAVDTYTWISDNYFLYSVYGEGIYRFDATNGENIVVVEDKDKPCKIEKVQNDVLIYDGKEIFIEY